MAKEEGLKIRQGDIYFSSWINMRAVILMPYQHGKSIADDDISLAAIQCEEPLKLSLSGSAPFTDVKEVLGHIEIEDLRIAWRKSWFGELPIIKDSRRIR